MTAAPLSERRLAEQAAGSAHRSGRGIVNLDDLTGEALLWMVEHPDKMETWREEGRHGANKIRYACRMHCLGVVAKERKRHSRLQHGDLHYYSPAVLRELLPDIFDYNNWVGGAPAPTDQIRAASRPAEGHNRLAMLVDVVSMFSTLPAQDQLLLRQLHYDYVTYEELALTHEVSDRTIRRREERAIDRLVERLGGEPPWHHR